MPAFHFLLSVFIAVGSRVSLALSWCGFSPRVILHLRGGVPVCLMWMDTGSSGSLSTLLASSIDFATLQTITNFTPKPLK